MVHVQMAGIHNVKDALMCVECGVDIIGLLVGQRHPSIDFISKEKAKEIKEALPKNVKTTLITHLEDEDEVIEIAKFIGVDYVQIHSSMTEEGIKKIRKALPKLKISRVIYVASDGEILTDYRKMQTADFYFTDSRNDVTGQVGGTGLEHDYRTDKMLVETLNKPVFVAGGLTPENVGRVVKLCHPYAVDVNSGCRGSDGGRSYEKVKKFVQNANK